MNDDLGAKFWLKLIGLVIVFGIAALLLFLLIEMGYKLFNAFEAYEHHTLKQI